MHRLPELKHAPVVNVEQFLNLSHYGAIFFAAFMAMAVSRACFLTLKSIILSITVPASLLSKLIWRAALHRLPQETKEPLFAIAIWGAYYP